MKKFISCFLVVILTVGLCTSAFADETVVSDTQGISVVTAVNEELVVVNGVETRVTAPVLVFDKTYVDLYAFAPILGASVHWIEDYIGYFKVNAGEKICDFTLVSHWDDLINQQYKFFVMNSKIFVSLRELCDLAGYTITYNSGVLTIGDQCDFDIGVYGDISRHTFDNYVYSAYPYNAENVVYPYQKYSYEMMIADAARLQQLYPELIKLSSIGQSVEGRNLMLIEYGKGDTRIFVCGTHHAREYIATTYLMYALDRYSYAYRNGTMWGKYDPREILDNITFCIVPMVNPDGVNLVQNGIGATQNPEQIASMGIYEGKKYGYSAWKANVRGVDLNWNYDKDWTTKKNKNPRGSSGFTGDRPYTEPETIAVSDYVDNNMFDAYMSFHTQGEIFYWADDENNPTYLQHLIKKDTGFVPYKDPGEGVGGSFFDYVYRKYHKPTITIELCPYIGNYPYPDSDFNTVWNPTKNILLLVGNEILYNKNK